MSKLAEYTIGNLKVSASFLLGLVETGHQVRDIPPLRLLVKSLYSTFSIPHHIGPVHSLFVLHVYTRPCANPSNQ